LVKLQQDQVWRVGEKYMRIVRLERLAVVYKLTDSLLRDGAHQEVSKKEFCRLIKGGELAPPQAPKT